MGEKPKFETRAGIVFSPLTLNLAIELMGSNANFDGIYKYLDQDNRDEDVVVVVSVAPGSTASRSGSAVQVGQVVKQIKGKKVTTLGSICKQISTNSRYLTIEGDTGSFAVFSAKTMNTETVPKSWKDTENCKAS